MLITAGADISSSSAGSGIAGDVALTATSLTIEDSTVQTSSRNAGGRINLTAGERLVIKNCTVTTSGTLLAENASLLRVSSPLTTINRTRMFSLTGGEIVNSQTLQRTGRVDIRSDLAIVSIDSEIAAGTAVTILGLDSELGSDTQLTDAIPSNVVGLANGTCIASKAVARSSLMVAGHRDLEHSAPDAPLAAVQTRRNLAMDCL